jgi:hypothetical protein
MTDTSYSHPVSQLLTYGDCLKLPRWPEELDYLPLGFGSEHIPDLIRMVLDDDLYWANSDSLEVWAPVHAWRVLGLLQAEAAIEPLLTRLDLVDEEDNDWVNEELPQVFAMIGAPAIAPIAAYLADPTHDTWACVAAAGSLGEIGKTHPEARDACVAALREILEKFKDNDRTVNAFVISNLLDLKAVQAAQLMERAFAADAVDLAVAGDWEEVQIQMGWKIARETPIPEGGWFGAEAQREDLIAAALRDEREHSRPSASKDKAKTKAKRKQAKKSRQKNRKR